MLDTMSNDADLRKAMNVTPITKLVLRSVPIPRSPLIDKLEQELGRPLTRETRHYLAGEPVHCGDNLELYLDGQWRIGRYEWTGRIEDLPTFEYDGGVRRIDAQCLIRWPE
jgi:hypothetical protein